MDAIPFLGERASGRMQMNLHDEGTIGKVGVARTLMFAVPNLYWSNFPNENSPTPQTKTVQLNNNVVECPKTIVMGGLMEHFVPKVPDDGYLPRIADGLLDEALGISGTVHVKGPKWCGKTATC